MVGRVAHSGAGGAVAGDSDTQWRGGQLSEAGQMLGGSGRGAGAAAPSHPAGLHRGQRPLPTLAPAHGKCPEPGFCPQTAQQWEASCFQKETAHKYSLFCETFFISGGKKKAVH